MSKPTQKHTKSRQRTRRATQKIAHTNFVNCPKCKKPLPPHTVCPVCGTYKEKEIVHIKLPKALRKKKAKPTSKDSNKTKEEKKEDKK